MENEALGKITAKQTPESQRIEAMEAEIEAINAETEEKEFQHKQLLHMSERLRKNQIMFDAHIKSMEDALRAGRKELADVTVYLRQARSCWPSVLCGRGGVARVFICSLI